MDVKIEQNGLALNGSESHVIVEPPSATASPAAHSDDDIYEDAGDLDFSRIIQNLYLTRIPKYLWESWSTLDDNEEIQIGTVRVEGSLEDIKRMSLILTPNASVQKNIPQEYIMHVANRKSTNTFIFSEKDLHGYTARSKTTIQSKLGAGALPSRAPNLSFQHRPGHNARPRDPTRRWQPYRRTIPKQTALIGQIQTELNCLPVENTEFKRIMDARAKEALAKPRRETKMVDRVYAPTGLRQANAFESGFTKMAKPIAGKGQHVKATRIARNDLIDQVFSCFKEHRYWKLGVMKERLKQPETYLKEVLEEVAELIKSGPFANHWQLNPHYQKIMKDLDLEVAPSTEVAGLSEDEEENVKMEDVN
ncbi:MAG: hypothetical protein Q9182_007033 [Xanthomendoza sp. 2 TL-2023]